MKKGTRRIPLTQGQFAIVDARDYDWLMQWSWQAHKNKPRLDGSVQRYAMRGINFTDKSGRHKTRSVYMHIQIAAKMKMNPNKRCDHKDRNGLNNTRSNLREATNSQNGWNREKSPGLTSRFKGVYRTKNFEQWRCYITVNGVTKNLGCFHNELDAANAYISAAKKYCGKFARHHLSHRPIRPGGR